MTFVVNLAEAVEGDLLFGVGVDDGEDGEVAGTCPVDAADECFLELLPAVIRLCGANRRKKYAIDGPFI